MCGLTLIFLCDIALYACPVIFHQVSMPKYYKVYDSKQKLYVTLDDGGALIIKDEAGRKVFLSKY